MKYLKRFESKEEYYKELNSDPGRLPEEVALLGRIEVKKSDFKFLFDDKRFEVRIFYDRNDNPSSFGVIFKEEDCIFFRGVGLIDMFIYGLKDEYFVVRFNDDDQLSYYLCDQIDGVKMLLKDKGVL